MSNAPRKSGWAYWIKGVLLHGLIFAAAGPAIGTIASPGVMLLPLALVVAYYTSTLAAFVAGCLVGAVSRFIRQPTPFYLTATVIGAVLGACVPLWMGSSSDMGNLIVIHAISGAFAGAVCSYLTKGVRRQAARS